MTTRAVWSTAFLALVTVGCGSKDDTGDTSTDATATATGTGTGATGTGTGATGTGTGATGTGTGTTGTGTGMTGTGTGMTGTGTGGMTGTGTGGMTGTGTGGMTGTGTGGMTGTGTGGMTGTGTGMTGTGTGGTTSPYPVSAIQQGTYAEDTEVMVVGAVVSAIGPAGAWVQDRQGGPWSGIYVYMGTDWESSYGALALGDVVDVAGVYVEYFGLSEISLIASATPSITKTGTANPPAPYVVSLDAVNLSDDAVAEPWEGVLLQINDCKIANPDAGNGQFLLTSTSETYDVYVDDLNHRYSGFDGLTEGQDMSGIKGPLHYSFSEWKLEPTSDADFP